MEGSHAIEKQEKFSLRLSVVRPSCAFADKIVHRGAYKTPRPTFTPLLYFLYSQLDIL